MTINDYEVFTTISADELTKELAKTKALPDYITIINILPAKYFNDCRIKNSINIEASIIADSVDDWDRTRFIVIYGAAYDLTICKGAYDKFTGMGFTRVHILLGGMQEWLDDSHPTEGLCKMDYLQK